MRIICYDRSHHALILLCTLMMVLSLLSACTKWQPPQPATDGNPGNDEMMLPYNGAADVIVYASDIPESALYELDRIENAGSPGGIMIGLPNTGDELDPPPENDPHLSFPVQVIKRVAYRCWLHMRVGTPKGKSQANVVWVQFSNAVDKDGQPILEPETNSYLTAHGPEQEGWNWVSCDLTGSNPPQNMIYFRSSGSVNVRVQAGMEGVGFDQFVLSPDKYLKAPPSEAIVKK